MRMSYPSSRRCVANEWRNVCGVACFAIPARRTATFTAPWSTVSWRWCRRRSRVSRSTEKRVAGTSHGHPHSRPALGCLRPSAAGSATPGGPAREVALVLRAAALEVARQVRLDGGGPHRDPVLPALGVPHGDLVGREVDVLHAQPAALEPAEPGPIEQVRHQPRHALESLQDRLDLVAGEDDW